MPNMQDPNPNARAAARRALCLASLVLRARVEYELRPEPGDSPSADERADPEFVDRQNAWLEQEGLWEATSGRERAWLEKKLGAWTRQEIANGQWREEALAVLIWALHPGTPMPAYDQPAFSTALMTLVPHPGDSHAFVAEAKLRDSNEISQARDVAELWLWRARTTQLQREHHEPPKGMSYEYIIATTAKMAQEEGLFRAIEGDFPASGKPYAKLSEREWETMRSIATERLYALNWLRGRAEDWDQVPTDT